VNPPYGLHLPRHLTDGTATDTATPERIATVVAQGTLYAEQHTDFLSERHGAHYPRHKATFSQLHRQITQVAWEAEVAADTDVTVLKAGALARTPVPTAVSVGTRWTNCSTDHFFRRNDLLCHNHASHTS